MCFVVSVSLPSYLLKVRRICSGHVLTWRTLATLVLTTSWRCTFQVRYVRVPKEYWDALVIDHAIGYSLQVSYPKTNDNPCSRTHSQDAACCYMPFSSQVIYATQMDTPPARFQYAMAAKKVCRIIGNNILPGIKLTQGFDDVSVPVVGSQTRCMLFANFPMMCIAFGLF